MSSFPGGHSAMAQMTATPVATRAFSSMASGSKKASWSRVKSPFDGSVVARVFQGHGNMRRPPYAAAVKAFGTTRRLPAFERQRVLRRVAESDHRTKRRICPHHGQEAGKPIKARAPKWSGRFLLSPWRRRKARAFTANIFRSTGRNTPPGAGESCGAFRWAQSPASRRLISR